MTVDPPPEEQDTDYAVVFVSDVSHMDNSGKVHPLTIQYMQRELTFTLQG